VRNDSRAAYKAYSPWVGPSVTVLLVPSPVDQKGRAQRVTSFSLSFVRLSVLEYASGLRVGGMVGLVQVLDKLTILKKSRC